MIFEYCCPLCSFLFRVARTYTHYKCPSCDAVVQAIPYTEKEQPPVEMPPAGKKEEVH